MSKHRETTQADWQTIDRFFNAAFDAWKRGDMNDDQFRYWITHFIGNANNDGIDAVIEGMQTVLANEPVRWTM